MGRRGVDPRRMKKWKRKVLDIIVSPLKTNRGNPRHYEFKLECGHTMFKFHGANTSVKLFIFFKKIGEVTTYCHDCYRGFPPSPKCEKTQMPIGFMPRNKCRDCEEDSECFDKLREWKAFRLNMKGSK